MDLGLEGRTAIVCASSRGLGRACAEALSRAGCLVVVNGRHEGIVAATAAAISQASGHPAIPVVADVSTHEGQDALLAACPEPDILINNNGGPPPADFRKLDRDAMLAGVVQNMVTPIELIQRVIDGMVERRFGRIVNITSASVRMPLPNLDLSSGARAGLTGFLAGVARQVAHANVTINHILPGMFETDRLTANIAHQAKTAQKSEEDMRAQRLATVPAGRFGTPAEFGDLCAFLCSAQAGYITGQNLLIDGGTFRSAF